MRAAHEQPACSDGAAATGHEAAFNALNAPKRRRPQDKTVDLSSRSLSWLQSSSSVSALHSEQQCLLFTVASHHMCNNCFWDLLHGTLRVSTGRVVSC